jgi:hypothetical protein
VIHFPPGRHFYALRVDIELTNERRYAVKEINIAQFDAEAARDDLLRDLDHCDFEVEKVGEFGLVILGMKNQAKGVVIKSSKLTVRGLDDKKPSKSQPILTDVGGVTVTTDK